MRHHSRVLLALLLVLALVAASCGGDDGGESTDAETGDPGEGATDEPDEPDESTDPDDETPAEDPDGDDAASEDPGADEPELRASARGITEDTIHIGLAIADVTAFSNTGDQKARFQAVADVINDNGGIIGRQLELHFAEWELP